MMRRLMLGALIAGTTAATAHADWDHFWHGVQVDYARNNAWPYPFREAEASQVRSHFAAVVDSGWRTQNAMGNELFRPGDQMLSDAGRNRLKRIVRTNPEGRRVVFVTRADSPQDTEARVAVVRTTLQDLTIDGQAPEIYIVEASPPTSSGDLMTKIQRARIEQLPAPVLPADTSSSSFEQ